MNTFRTILLVGLLLCAGAAMAIPDLINYQGYLTNSEDAALDTVVSMTFKMYDSATLGTQLWTETQPSCTVRTGMFHVKLGTVTAVPDSFSRAQVWLGVTLGNNSEMIPRTRFVSVPYAYRVRTIDGAKGGSIGGPVYIDTTLQAQGIRFYDGTVQWTAADTTGFATRMWVQSNGYLRGANNFADPTGFVGGGDYNRSRGIFSVVAGGGGWNEVDSNSAIGDYSSIGGGNHNTASGGVTTVGGGEINSAIGYRATVGGGYYNTARGQGAVVSGGTRNTADSSNATIGGGDDNHADGYIATVGGGENNRATGVGSTVPGGTGNVASNDFATVSGGESNTSNNYDATVGGGVMNTASGWGSVVSGGILNTASGDVATVGGGRFNRAWGMFSVISGGGGYEMADSNLAIGDYSVIPGGTRNEAWGAFSLAAGHRAKANHAGAYVWADSSSADFSSTAHDQYLIRATGGVGINTNAPAEALEVNGDVKADTFRVDAGLRFSDGSFQNTATIFGNSQQYADTNTYDATRTWVNGRGFLISAQAYSDTNTYDATRTWVQRNGYQRSANNVAVYGGFVGGGFYNKASGSFSVVVGGGTDSYADSNFASAFASAIGGGYRNWAQSDASVICGGNHNTINTNANEATIGGGVNNTVSTDAMGATISGGSRNTAGNFATIGGGANNTAGYQGTVGGGSANTASAPYTTVAGGSQNIASNDYSTVGGGTCDTSSGIYATVCGGYSNVASSFAATTCGGYRNLATGSSAAVVGGQNNDAYGTSSTIGGGLYNTASGLSATVPGGAHNRAGGYCSFAAGFRAKAYNAGAFVWADNTDADFTSTADNQFNVRASGGVRMFTNSGTSLGAQLAANATAWTALSDSTKKTDIRLVDTKQVLEKVEQLPISEWRYKEQPDPTIRHIGPMAQDFWKQFHLGEDSLGISTIDPDGIALAAIQELAKKNEKLEERIAQLEKQLQLLVEAKSSSIQQTALIHK